MAINLLPIHIPSQSVGLSSAPTRRISTVNRRILTTTAAAGANKWWSPIFEWSSEADYIDSDKEEPVMKKPAKFPAGCFTEEKARQMRKMSMESETHCEAMYHSAVASRLATDFPRRR